MELLKVANCADCEMLKSLRFSREYLRQQGICHERTQKPSVEFVETHGQDDVSDVDAPILIDRAAFRYALHYHTSAVD